MWFLHSTSINIEGFHTANRLFTKLRGLYFRKTTDKIALYPCKSIHTLFFSRDIDVAFLDKNLKVLRVIRKLKPWNFAYCKNSYCVIERFSNDDKWYEIGEVLS